MTVTSISFLRRSCGSRGKNSEIFLQKFNLDLQLKRVSYLLPWLIWLFAFKNSVLLVFVLAFFVFVPHMSLIFKIIWWLENYIFKEISLVEFLLQIFHLTKMEQNRVDFTLGKRLGSKYNMSHTSFISFWDENFMSEMAYVQFLYRKEWYFCRANICDNVPREKFIYNFPFYFHRE